MVNMDMTDGRATDRVIVAIVRAGEVLVRVTVIALAVVLRVVDVLPAICLVLSSTAGSMGGK
jgi:hypothetical protein